MASKLSQDWRSDRETKLDVLHEQLTSAVNSLVSGDDWVAAMTFAARFRSRSFNNTLLIFAQHTQRFQEGLVGAASPTYVAGFRQWETLGRAVVKGQRGYMIQAPVTQRWTTGSDGELSGRRLGHREKPEPGERVRTRLVGVKPAYVWDVCQTSGADVPQRPTPRLLAGAAPAGLWEGLAAQIEQAGFRVSVAVSATPLGGANGVTDYVARTVQVRGDMDEAARVKTLAHELAHVLMHDPTDEDVRAHRGIREVEAESVAMMIGAAHAMPTDSYTVPYVSTWASTVAGRTPSEVVRATGERVRGTAITILDRLDTPQVGGGDPPGLDRAAPSGPRPTAAGPSLSVQVTPLAGQVIGV